MTDHERARLRDEQDRERFAIRKLEREMAAEERRLTDGLDRLEDDIEGSEEGIDRELRAEHYGREPEPPTSWPESGPNGRDA